MRQVYVRALPQSLRLNPRWSSLKLIVACNDACHRKISRMTYDCGDDVDPPKEDEVCFRSALQIGASGRQHRLPQPRTRGHDQAIRLVVPPSAGRAGVQIGTSDHRQAELLITLYINWPPSSHHVRRPCLRRGQFRNALSCTRVVHSNLRSEFQTSLASY